MDTGIFLARNKLTGEIVNIFQVERGNACNCQCINCNSDLQARKGDIRRPHFKHLAEIECNPETILHKIAKQIFIDNTYVILPDGKGVFHYTDAKEEQFIFDQKPDIILVGQEKRMHVEIAVTSFIGYKKRQKIIANKFNTLEIDLSNIGRDISYQELSQILLNKIDRKEIIYWDEDSNASNKINGQDNSWIGGIVLFIFGLFIWRRIKRKRRKKNKRRDQLLNFLRRNRY